MPFVQVAAWCEPQGCGKAQCQLDCLLQADLSSRHPSGDRELDSPSKPSEVVAAHCFHPPPLASDCHRPQQIVRVGHWIGHLVTLQSARVSCHRWKLFECQWTLWRRWRSDARRARAPSGHASCRAGAFTRRRSRTEKSSSDAPGLSC